MHRLTFDVIRRIPQHEVLKKFVAGTYNARANVKCVGI